jgi:hypothetical protein
MSLMDFFYRYSFLFFFGGFCGWVLELFFRRFVSQHKWVNPGFLTGPCLPLYGFGLVAFYLFANAIKWQQLIQPVWFSYIVEILVIGLSLTLLEYLAGLIFIKGMKIKLWDYSKRWGNIQGIICPAFSLIWTAIGAFYIFVLNPGFVAMTSFVMDDPMHLLGFGTAEGFCYGILFLDLGWSLGLYAKIRKAVQDRKLVVDWDKIKVSIQDHFKKIKEHHSWVFPFSHKMADFSDLVKEYLAVLKVQNAEEATEKARVKALRKARFEARHHHEAKEDSTDAH